MKDSLCNFGKIALCRQTEAGRFYEKGTLFYACCETFTSSNYERTEVEWEQETADFKGKRGDPANETVVYKIGGTELLYDKMKRLIKAESVKTPTDKKEKSAMMRAATCLPGGAAADVIVSLILRINTEYVGR